MAQLIKINNQHLPVKEYKGQRVVTFKEIDKVHGRADGTAHRNFKTNKNRFIEGVDYFRLQKDEIRPFGITSPNGGIVLTESGYLMLAKSFTDDLAWAVQRELVNNYFRVKGVTKNNAPEQLTLETTEYHYFDKTLYGEPVLTAADVEHFTGIGAFQTEYYLKKYTAKNTDYAIISGKTLVQYKDENPGVNKLASAVFVIMKSGFVKLMKYFGCGTATPECFLKSSITENEKKPDKEKYALIVGNSRVVRLMDMINKRITAIEVTMDLMYKHNVEVGKMDALRKTLNELSLDLCAEISALTYEKLGATEKYMY